ncbi:MAG: hypothetical protein QW407_06780 [Thermofilaceae archaeon]
MSEEERVEEGRDVEELREVLKVMGEFFKELVPTLKELIETFMSGLRGDVLGEEVAKFYKSLIEAGIKEDIAARYAEEFLKRKMEILNVIPKLISEMKLEAPQKKEVEVIEKKGEKEE